MRPILFELFGWSVPAYGATLAATFVVGLLAVRSATRELGVEDRHILDLGLIAVGAMAAWAIVGVLLASRGLAGTMHLSAIPILSAGAVGFLWYLRSQQLPAEHIFDRIAPIAAASLAALYGIGTLLAGTGYGRPTSWPWGLTFPPGSPAARAFGYVPLQPVQLYLAGGFLLLAVAARHWRDALAPGRLALLTFIGIAAWYLAISPLRATRSLFQGEGARASEIVAIFVIGFSSAMLLRMRGRRKAQ